MSHYKLQKNIRDQLLKSLKGGVTENDNSNIAKGSKFFDDNDYNLPNDVTDYIKKFFSVKDKTRKILVTEW